MRRTVNIDAAQTVIIDALQGETFIIWMDAPIGQLGVKNVSPGQLYLFRFMQDSFGGHTVGWGGGILNMIQPDPMPNSTSVQSCIGMTGGVLQANLPGSWQSK
jgi:hypothetical protein